MRRFSKHSLMLFALLAGMILPAAAQPKNPDALGNPLAQVLLAIAFLLLVCIALLGYVINGASYVFRKKMKEEREAGKSGVILGITALLMLMSNGAIAQEAAEVVAAAPEPTTINGLSFTAFYLLVGVIVFEIMVIMAMVYQLKFLAGIKTRSEAVKAEASAAAVPAKPKTSWWWKLNQAVSEDREKDIDLSHDYDGISELDNKVPPWWSLAFVFTILFGVVYMYRYHVSESAPLQIEELEIAMKKGEEQRQLALKKSASNVDENTITVMDAAAIGAGKAIYDQNCVSCHGTAGEGNAVGPNLTDKYWIHGGDIKDIFKTVKYGWPEKGMQAWKEILGPVKMAQVSNYVYSLQGTNPPNAKEPQGDLYQPSAPAAATDSSATATTATGMK